jgi:hypothetical protein
MFHHHQNHHDDPSNTWGLELLFFMKNYITSGSYLLINHFLASVIHMKAMSGEKFPLKIGSYYCNMFTTSMIFPSFLLKAFT